MAWLITDGYNEVLFSRLICDLLPFLVIVDFSVHETSYRREERHRRHDSFANPRSRAREA